MLAAAVMFSAGCSDDTEIDSDGDVVVENYINLSADSYTFEAADETIFTITVESAPAEWATALEKAENTWLNFEADGDTLTVHVEDNDSEEPRTATIVFTNEKTSSTATFTQRGVEPAGIARFRMIEGMESVVMSPEGTYAAAMKVAIVDDSHCTYTPVVIETATGKRTEMNDNIVGPDANTFVITAISDNGTMILSNDTSPSSIIFYMDGTTAELPYPAGDFNRIVGTNISSDGNTIIGYVAKGSACTPVKWVNMTPHIMPMLTVNGWGDPCEWGMIPRGMSSDCSIIYGNMQDNGESVLWKDSQVDFLAPELHEIKTIRIKGFMGREVDVEVSCGPRSDAGGTRMSQNGKYVAFKYRDAYADENMAMVQVEYPGVLNTETGETTILTDYPNYYGWSVDDEGNLSLHNQRIGSAYNVETDGVVPTPEWVYNTYGIHVAYPNSSVAMRTIDGSAMLGVTYTQTVQSLQFTYWYIVPPVE